MMRVCHLNTCPVGVATQDPVLRERFEGQPEHVVNYLFMVAEEARRIMASLGVRNMLELIGRTELLDADDAVEHWKARDIDLRPLLARAGQRRAGHAALLRAPPRPGALRLDRRGPAAALPPGDRGRARRCGSSAGSRTRTARWAGSCPGEIARAHGEEGLPEGSIHVLAHGLGRPELRRLARARASSSCWTGDANDYCGKGLSGGTIVVRPAGGRRVRRRAQRDRRQHGALRRHLGPRVLPRARRRALRRPQLGRDHGGRGRSATTAAST